MEPALLLGRIFAYWRLGAVVSNWSWEELDKRVRSRLTAKYPRDPDIVQETITRLFIHLSGGGEVKVSPEALAGGIAENVWRESRRKESRYSEIVTEIEVVTPQASPPVRSEEELTQLKRDVFSTTERKLFDEYYRYGGNVQKRHMRLANKLGISVNTLYQRAFRLKERLISEQRRRDAKGQQ